jgi:hypothetical protein
LAAFLMLCTAADAQSLAKEHIDRAKAATAMLVVDGKAAGAAYCIHPEGYFVSSASAFPREFKECALILYPGESGQRQRAARVVRSAGKQDLVLLRADEGHAEMLPVGGVKHLTETTPIFVAGFAAGMEVAPETGVFPNISISTGRISALRKQEDRVVAIQFDALIDRGGIGGPVLDEKGEVVGTVSKGKAEGVNLAGSAGLLKSFLARPEVETTFPGSLAWSERHTPQRIAARIITLTSITEIKGVEFRIDDGLEERVIPVAPDAEGRYAMDLPLIAEAAENALPIRLRLGGMDCSGELVMAGEIQIGGRNIGVSELAAWTATPPGYVQLRSGELLPYDGRGAGELTLRLAGQALQASVESITALEVEVPAYSRATALEVRVMSPKSEFISVKHEVAWTDMPAPAPTRPTPKAVRATPGLRGPGIEGRVLPTPIDPVKEFGTRVFNPPKGFPREAPAGLDAAGRSIPLPDALSNVVWAGGGRFALLVFPRIMKLGAFDLNKAEFVAWFPMDTPRPLIAGGADCFFVADPDARTISRYDLHAMEKEATQLLPFEAKLTALQMGAASSGPLVAFWPGSFENDGGLLDIYSLRNYEPLPHEVVVMRDGTLIKSPGRGPTHNFKYFLPAERAGYIYSNFGLYADTQDPLFRDAPYSYAYPAACPELYLSMPRGEGSDPGARGALIPASEIAPLAILPPLGIRLSPLEYSHGPSAEPWRVYFDAKTETLVSFPLSNESIELRLFSPADQLMATGSDFLRIVSLPAHSARPSRVYRYPMEVLSRHGGLRFSMEAGAPEMTLSEDGLFTWIPGAVSLESREVVLKVEDALGQTRTQTLSLAPAADGGFTVEKKPVLPEVHAAAARIVVPPGMLPPSFTSVPQDVLVGGEFTQCELAGDGRYLLLVVPAARELAIFDVETGTISARAPLPSEKVLVAGGARHYFVFDQENHLIARYNLQTLERELAQVLPIHGEIERISMGYASEGPLYLGAGPMVVQLDAKSLYDFSFITPSTSGLGKLSYPSPDGTVAGLVDTSFVTLVSPGKEHVRGPMTSEPKFVIPGPGGGYVYTNRSVLTGAMKEVFSERRARLSLPSTAPAFYLSVAVDDKDKRLAIHLAGEEKTLAYLGTLDEFNVPVSALSGAPWRLHYIEAAEALISLPQSNDRLIVRRVNLEACLREAGGDFLLVRSTPPAIADPGSVYIYAVQALSSRGGVEFALEDPAPGMALSPEGQFSWQVPEDFVGETAVIIRVQDSGGGQFFHTFKVRSTRPASPADSERVEPKVDDIQIIEGLVR